jgi:lysine 2,3-aminomutase
MCASYCRFCTRKRKVGDPAKIHPRYIEDGIDYIRAHSEVRDVIIPGGDPLLLSDWRLESILSRLRAIPHIEILPAKSGQNRGQTYTLSQSVI